MNEIISFMRDEPLVMTLCPEEESILLNKNVLKLKNVLLKLSRQIWKN